MKNGYFLPLILLSGILLVTCKTNPNPTGPANIIDHTCTDSSLIPAQYLDAVKDMVFWSVGESHSRQIQEGLRLLGVKEPAFAARIFNTPGNLPEPGTLRVMRYGYDGFNNHTWAMTFGEEYFWSSDESRSSVKTVAEEDQPDVAMWSWCWDIANNRLLQWNGSAFDNIIAEHTTGRWQAEHMQIYLDAVREYNANAASSTVFVYQTAVTDNGTNGEAGYRTQLLNDQIRDWVASEGGFLFDWADIETHSAAGTDHNLVSWTDDTGIFGTAGAVYEYESRHPDWDGDVIGHTVEELCILKARAVWWMLARIAGWES